MTRRSVDEARRVQRFAKQISSTCFASGMVLPDAVDAVARMGHVIGAVIWVGFVTFMAFVRPRAMMGVSESTTRELMPRLSKTMMPWMMWSAIATVVFGAIVYYNMGVVRGFENLGWTLQLGAVLALVMFVVGMTMVVPTGKKVARLLEGGAPPTPAEMKRLGMATRINGWLGISIVLLMVLHGRFGNTL